MDGHAGVIGRTILHYDVWGPTVNLASRLESRGAPGAIYLDAATAGLLEGRFALAPLGDLVLPGFGAKPAWRLQRSR